MWRCNNHTTGGSELDSLCIQRQFKSYLTFATSSNINLIPRSMSESTLGRTQSISTIYHGYHHTHCYEN